MTAVFRGSRSRGSARLVLLALADVAADTGHVTAYRRSQTHLARYANVDEKTIPRAIDSLLKLGELVLIDQDGNEHATREASGHGRRSTDYRIRLEVLDPASDGVRELPPQTPQVTGSDPAAGEGQTPQDAGSIIPSSSDSPPSLPVAVPAAPKAKPATKSLLPDTFVVDLDMRAWAQENAPNVDADRELERFSDYWRSKGERRADWTATWRNWMRRAQEDAARRPQRPGRPRPPARPLEQHQPADSVQGGKVDL